MLPKARIAKCVNFLTHEIFNYKINYRTKLPTVAAWPFVRLLVRWYYLVVGLPNTAGHEVAQPNSRTSFVRKNYKSTYDEFPKIKESFGLRDIVLIDCTPAR